MKNMINDLTTESAWKKTSQFIQEKYGKKIEFRTMSATSGDVESAESERVSYFSQGDDLVVPLKYKQTDLGQVIVCRGATLAFEQQLETVDLIQFLIEPQAYNRMLKLEINAYSANTTDTEEETTNVINLFSNPAAEEIDEEESQEEGRRRLVSKFIHIRAKSSLARHKVAYKIHEMTGTIVFLRLQDLTDGKTKVEHDMDLSDTAIYVDNLTELNENQLDLLERMARQNLKGNSVIIVGSSLSEDEIHHLDCSQTMKNDLLALSYDADRVPVSQQASEEILDLLFFNDDDMIS